MTVEGSSLVVVVRKGSIERTEHSVLLSEFCKEAESLGFCINYQCYHYDQAEEPDLFRRLQSGKLGTAARGRAEDGCDPLEKLWLKESRDNTYQYIEETSLEAAVNRILPVMKGTLLARIHSIIFWPSLDVNENGRMFLDTLVIGKNAVRHTFPNFKPALRERNSVPLDPGLERYLGFKLDLLKKYGS